MQRTLVITGKGKLSVYPDLTIIKFPVSNLNMNYGKAIDDLNEKVALLRDIIYSLGIGRKELKTSDFRITRETERNKKTEKYEFVGFMAHHDLVLEIPFDNSLTNKIINSISNLDSEISFRISFGIKDPEACLDLLIENAIKNAKTKASIIAKSSEVSLKEILNINYSFSSVYFHSDTDLEYDSMYAMSEQSMADITPSDIDMSENVTITWRIE